MDGLELHLSSGWSAEPLPIEIDLAELMLDLDPHCDDWVPPAAVAS